MSVLADLAAHVDALTPDRRVRVAIDGVDCAGKTTLADALAGLLRRPVVRASADGFCRPRAERYRQGRASPVGCYEDTTDLPALRERLLEPFASTGRWTPRSFDLDADRAVEPVWQQSPATAALLVDGLFLQRPDLAGCFELVLHLRVPDEEVLRRAAARDGADALPLYRSRYLPAQRLYEAAIDPAARADVVLDSTDPASPIALRS